MITLREVSAEIVLVGGACMDFAGSAGVCSNTAVRIRAENAGTSEVPPTIPVPTGKTFTKSDFLKLWTPFNQATFTRGSRLTVTTPPERPALGAML